MKFKSKIGVWFHFVMLLIITGCALPICLGIIFPNTPTLITGLIIAVIIIPFCFSIYLNTYYTLEETALRIRCGFVINKRISYKDIESVYETKDPSASAGLSLDRISINTAKSEWLISPKNKQEFLKLLNERMEVKV